MFLQKSPFLTVIKKIGGYCGCSDPNFWKRFFPPTESAGTLRTSSGGAMETVFPADRIGGAH
jgi:hypothetical protein